MSLVHLTRHILAAASSVLVCPRHANAQSLPHDVGASGSGLTLITGANNASGIGYSLAALLLEDEGRPVIITARTQQKADAAAAELRAAAGGAATVHALQLDLASRTSIEAAAAHLRRDFDQQACLVVCLVNNAGANTLSWSQRGWDTEYAANFDGPLRLTELLAPALQPGALVINVTSSLGQLGPGDTEWGAFPGAAYRERIASATSLPQLRAIGFDGGDAAMQADARSGRFPCPTYKTTKAMLNKATQLLATDASVMSRGISICAVCPGSCASDMNPLGRKTARQGADSIAWCMRQPRQQVHGKFWMDGRELRY